MKEKVSGTYQGKCDLCSNVDLVFTIGDEESKKVVTICKSCVDKNAGKTIDDMIDEHGVVDETPFQPGVKIEGKGAAG